MTDFYPLTIEHIERETDDAVVMTFSVPALLKTTFNFQPGQYLTLRTTVGGEALRRCYSICSAANESELKVGIKAIPNGRFSQYANQELKVGDKIDVMPPQGHFGFEPKESTNKQYLGIAVGSGITPIISMLKSVLAQEPNSQFTLLYGNKNLKSTMFKNQLSEFKNRYPDRLHLVYLFSRESNEAELLNGRLDPEKLRDLGQSLFDWSQFDACYMCGPEEMLEASYIVLSEGGMDERNFHVERFNTASGPRPTIENKAAYSRVNLRRDGRVLDLEMTSDDDSLLDAALRQGADLPYACKGGVCATCICKVTSGNVEMAVNYSLEQDQLDKGYVLSCQAVPTTDEVTIDFDV
ncbi:1,2-phenylacetyl-CoA epoxidase subunit PaaE [Photobacterium minamisatsumaniensis]|uniref:1,2-phenylacetyl-CoA epoxidase subunit PaaE n=1 Tax=Photobacterium minamisatsumaniensis TaxID=2910233 RepID=UPI003D10759C